METRANHVWVGAVTLFLLATLAAFIVWVAGLSNSQKKEYDIFFKQSVDGPRQRLVGDLLRRARGRDRRDRTVADQIPNMCGCASGSGSRCPDPARHASATIQSSFTGTSKI